jgi:hypothetical protein
MIELNRIDPLASGEPEMSMQCEKIDTCPFFAQFRDDSGVIKGGWIAVFCNDKVKALDCARKKHLMQTGEMAPENMTPGGTFL